MYLEVACTWWRACHEQVSDMHEKESDFSNHPLGLLMNKNIYLNKHRSEQGVGSNVCLSFTPEGHTPLFKSGPGILP